MPRLDPVRIDRQWAAIQSKMKATARRPRVSRVTVGGALAMAAAILLFVLFRGRPGAPLVDGAVLETGPQAAGTSATLVEGSRLALDKDSKARLVEARRDSVRIELERGGVTIEATHVNGRRFVVASEGYEVIVVGTRFAVHRLASEVEVTVEVGQVDVRSPDGSSRPVRGGETWRAQIGPTTVAPPEPQEAPSAVASAPPPPPPPAPAPVVSEAKALFDEAQRARADGRVSDAASAFDKLRRNYRSDPRAGLAAFELGRLRLDALGDARGAEEALRDAIALSPRAAFREDAEARRVQALAKMGDKGGCTAARDAYLSRYPDGVHRKGVVVYCDGP